MKHNMNRIFTTMALLVLTTITAWAEQKVKITVTPANSGTVNYAVNNGVCTLTAVPAEGYYLTVDNLTAVATLDGGAVQSPRRTIDVVDGTPVAITHATGDDPSATTTYTIEMPADANLNVEVTAEFQARTSIEGATVTVAVPEGGIIFNGSEQKPAIASVVLATGTALTSADYTVSGYSNNINAGDNAEVTVVGQGKYVGSATGTFTINPARATLSYDKSEVTTAINVTPTWPVLDNPQGAIVEFTSSNLDVATVDENGSVKIKATGETIIKAAINDHNYQYADASYTLTVTSYAYNLKIDGMVVTDDNREELFDKSVMFDGKSTLTLTDAQISGIESGLDELDIYVIGNNIIDSNTEYAIWDMTGGKQYLHIYTDMTEPGTLELSSNNQVVSGFKEISVKEPMAIIDPDYVEALNEEEVSYALLGTPIDPIVDNHNKTNNVDYGSGDPKDPLTNIVIDDVLYTLNDLQTEGLDDDGIYNGMLIINSVMTDDQVEEAIQMIPTTEEYANTFKGITFMVPAGSGTVTITAMTQDGHALCVKIGNHWPIPIQTGGKLLTQEISYSCTSATYVYIYHVLMPSTASAPAEGSHRIGPKASVTTGVTGLSVSASNVDTPPGGMPDYLSFSRADLVMPKDGIGHIIVENDNITDLDEDAFSDLAIAAHAPQRASQNYDITYIDLRGTSITGKEFSREEGPFKGLPETTFVYLPAGNEVSSPNMVVGSVCNEMLLGDGNHTFECAEEGFVAGHAVLERWFPADEKHPVYVPFDIKDSEKYGVFFEYNGVSDGMATMKKATTVAANMPYYLQAKEGGVEIIEGTSVNVNPVTNIPSTGMIGTYKPKWLPDAYYYDNGTKMFQKGADVIPFEAYLNIEGSAPLYVWWEGEEKPTAVDVICGNNGIDNDRWYSLDGRQLQQQPVQKGIYLKNGKKHIVK